MKLIASDLDNTWVGDNPAALADLQEAVLARRRDLVLVYVTGRDPDLYHELAREVGLLEPDYLIASVGTEIYRYPGTDPDRSWVDVLSGEGWSPATVDTVARAFPQLHPQPRQFDFKRSYYFTPESDEEEQRTLAALAAQLAESGVGHRLVYSSRRDLDILPVAAGKGEALKYLGAQLRLQAPQMIVCGDSGNDIDMLDRPWPSVVVSNAQAELLAAQLAEPVFRATAPASAGVLQGLKHFGFV